MAVKLGFEDFIASVDGECLDFVTELHNALTGYGCKMEVKEAKSGYVASYVLHKKTIANYVFRKSGLIARIYPNHIMEYMELLETLPDSMAKAVQAAPPCKRLLDPEACNPKCSMGFDFIMRGQRHQKCRYSAFQFPVCGEHHPHIKALLLHEAEACTRS